MPTCGFVFVEALRTNCLKLYMNKTIEKAAKK
jgi:hypothetical protein